MLLQNSVDVRFDKNMAELTPETLGSIHSVFNYRCVLSGSKDISSSEVAERWFLLGLGVRIW